MRIPTGVMVGGVAMRISDRIMPDDVDNRQMHLMALAVGVIVVLVVGLALLMYPAVLSEGMVVSGRTLRVLFLGFCALAVLLVGYLLDRQLTIRRLERQLAEQETQSIKTSVAGTLERYAELLRKIEKEAEAEEIASRAAAIRADLTPPN
jgi:hypothetical protein